MNHIYIDESGDLGFSAQSSPFFVIAAIVTNDRDTHHKLGRIPKKIRQRKLKKELRKQSELKFSNSSTVIREQFLSRAARLPIKVYALCLEKRYVAQGVKDDLNVLYQYLLKRLLEEALVGTHHDKELTICLDKCMSPKQRGEFENYIKTELLYRLDELPKVNIIHELSHNRPSLQVVDFICGAFGYKYNTMLLREGCAEYTDIIKGVTEVERNDIFKEKSANHTYWS